MDHATSLTGGRITKGVVRIGDTVRRPVSPKTPFTVELLRLLEGLDSVPRYLGQDDEGRDILTYLDGWVPARYGRWTDEQVAAVGRLLRAFHDATRGSRLAGHHDVVCHHDPGPTNFVFRDGMPAALIDFDTAEPGSATGRHRLCRVDVVHRLEVRRRRATGGAGRESSSTPTA